MKHIRISEKTQFDLITIFKGKQLEIEKLDFFPPDGIYPTQNSHYKQDKYRIQNGNHCYLEKFKRYHIAKDAWSLLHSSRFAMAMRDAQQHNNKRIDEEAMCFCSKMHCKRNKKRSSEVMWRTLPLGTLSVDRYYRLDATHHRKYCRGLFVHPIFVHCLCFGEFFVSCVCFIFDVMKYNG